MLCKNSNDKSKILLGISYKKSHLKRNENHNPTKKTWTVGYPAAVTWLKNCRYGAKLNPINHTINQSINQTINRRWAQHHLTYHLIDISISSDGWLTSCSGPCANNCPRLICNYSMWQFSVRRLQCCGCLRNRIEIPISKFILILLVFFND